MRRRRGTGKVCDASVCSRPFGGGSTALIGVVLSRCETLFRAAGHMHILSLCMLDATPWSSTRMPAVRTCLTRPEPRHCLDERSSPMPEERSRNHLPAVSAPLDYPETLPPKAIGVIQYTASMPPNAEQSCSKKTSHPQGNLCHGRGCGGAARFRGQRCWGERMGSVAGITSAPKHRQYKRR